MSKVVIFGVGQLAEIAFFYLTHDSKHDVAAFTVDQALLPGAQFHGLPVVAFENIEIHYPPSQYQMLIPMSHRNINKIRAEKYHEAKRKGYSFITYISSKAAYYGTPVGENCFILENNVIQPFTTIGNNCMLWSGNHIGHHSIIEDHCFIASQVVISGAVVIGEYTFIGVNSTLRDNIHIGKENFIGAGAVILKSTEDQSVFSPSNTEKSQATSKKLSKIT